MANKMALVTGASSGLGEHFSRLLANDGYDVVLVARSVDRLNALAQELNALGKGKAHVVSADLNDPASPQRLLDEAKQRGWEIEILINNAGFGSCGAFLDLPLGKEVEMLEVNVQALVKLCHLFGVPMRARKSGRILNIASTAAFQPGPFMATYYASKAFVLSFSQAFAYELRSSGVTVTCHCPGATATAFAQNAGNAKSRLFQRSGVATAKDTAAHAYRAMMAGKERSVHGALNWIGAVSAQAMPRLTLGVAANLNRP